MATPISSSRPAAPVSGKILDDYRWLAKNLAIYIHQAIPPHLEEHEGQINYDDFSEQVIQFMQRNAPEYKTYDMQVFLNALKGELKKRLEDLPFPHNRVAEPIFKRLMTELREKLLPKEEKHDRNSVSPGFSNTSRFNSLHAGVRQGVGEKGTVAAGVFRTGDTGTAFSQYAVYHYQWLNLNRPLLKVGVASSIGAFSLLPETDLENRYILGVIPSLNLFLGSEQSLGLGIRLREAVEWRPTLPVGIHLVADLHAPLLLGAAFEKRFAKIRVYGGGGLEFLPVMTDVQDMKSFGIAHEKSQWFTGVESPLVDTRVAVDLFRNETVGRLQLSKSTQFAGGLTTFALVGQSPLSGTWNAERPSVFLMINYAQRNTRSQVLAQVAVDLMAGKESTYATDTPGISFDAAQVSSAHETSVVGSKVTCDLSNYYKKGSNAITCIIPKVNKGAAVPCEMNTKTKEVQCNGTSTNAFEMKYKVDLAYQGIQLVGKSVVGETFVAKDPVLASIVNNTTRAGFITAMRSLSKDQQLGGLQQLPTILYRTYNSVGMATLTGDDTVNLIGPDEIYKSLRNYLTAPKSVDPTTVCRGIAKFVAGVAGELGYDSHVIGIRTSTLWHSFALVRETGKEYLALNYGDNVGYTGHKDMAGALLQFAKNNGYPPQLKFMIFNQNGQYERTIMTNEGRMVLETTTAPGQAQDFLEFR